MEDTNLFGTRLREKRKENKLTQKELADQIGAKHNSVSDWERGYAMPDPDTIVLICEALNVSSAYLLPSRREMSSSSVSLPTGLKRISEITPQHIRLIGEVAAGEPILAEEDYEAYIDVDTPIKADYALTVRGDSMEPTYLDGDVIYIRKRPDVDDGQIAVVLVDDSATLKHVYHDKDGVVLTSDNPKYPPMRKTFEDHDCIKILGIVVGYTRMYGFSMPKL